MITAHPYPRPHHSKSDTDSRPGFKWTVPDTPQPTDFFTTVITQPKPRPAVPIHYTTARVTQLLNQYDQMVQQSRSPNMLLSTYGWLKLNGLTVLLGILGIPFEALAERRKAAIAAAVADNQHKFNENEYNIEMILLIQGNTKSSKKPIASLLKNRESLQVHMAKLGQPDWYTPERVNRIQYSQLMQIESYFLDEADQLQTQKTYWHDVPNDNTVTVRIADHAVESAADIDQKLNQLDRYATRIHHRKADLDRTFFTELASNQESDIRAHEITLGLKHSGVLL